jgi:transcription antitermination factor NusG
MAKQVLNQGRRWYVLHTYSGYEENVEKKFETKNRVHGHGRQDL